MDVFLSYSSSGLQETRELLRTLGNAFASVDWVSADDADRCISWTPSRIESKPYSAKPFENGRVLLLMCPRSEVRTTDVHSFRGLVQSEANYEGTPLGAHESAHCFSFVIPGHSYFRYNPAASDPDASPLMPQCSYGNGLKVVDSTGVMANCIDPPPISQNGSFAGDMSLRAAVNMARSIGPFESPALRSMKSKVIMRLLASQALSAVDKLRFNWRLVESFILLIRPSIAWRFATELREVREQDAGCAIGVLKAASSELSRLFVNVSEELPIIRRRYQREQRPWFVAACQAENQVVKGNARVRSYSIEKRTLFDRKAKLPARRTSRELIDPTGIIQSSALAQMFRGVDGPLSIGPELRRRTVELVRRRALWSPVTASNQMLGPGTMYSLYKGFDAPSIAGDSGCDE